MKYEYGEPLGQSPVEGSLIVTSDGCRFAYFVNDSVRHRVIACINACAGLSNEQLEKIGLGGVAKILADRDQLKAHHELDNRVIAHLQNSLNERKTRSDGPPLTAKEAAEWEWTGEQPRKLRTGESGLSMPQGIGNCRYLIMSAAGPLTEGDYWPLRRRQTPKADESPNRQPATLDDIAELLACILDRMPKREAE